MKLNIITIITSALLPFSACIGMNQSSELIPVPSSSTLPWIPVERTQPYKKYIRRLAPKEDIVVQTKEILTPKKFDFDAIELEAESFFNNNPQLYDLLAEEHCAMIEEDFKKVFGYPIPTHSNCYKKTNFKNFVTLHNLCTNDREEIITSTVSYPTIDKLIEIEQLTKELQTYLKEEVKNILAEKERKEREEELFLYQELARLEKIRLEKEAENKRVINSTKEIKKKTKKTEQSLKVIIERIAKKEKLKEEIEQENKRLLLKQQLVQKISGLKKMRTKNTSKKSPLEETRATIFKLLMGPNGYNCANIKELKAILANQCDCCVYEQIAPGAAFHYIKRTDQFILLIGDEIGAYESAHGCQSTDDSSSD